MKRNKKSILRYLFIFLIFAGGIIVGLCLWNKISLPFHNPWAVLGTLTVLKYNPLNNIIRFIMLILSPVLLLTIFYFVNSKFSNINFFERNSSHQDKQNITPKLSTWGKTILTFSLIIFSMLLAITLSVPGAFDTFHEGETLGPAISYMSGKVPYKDFIFCHGLYQDPLRATIAFSLFGKSIGAVRTLESITQILSFVLLTIFTLRMYRRNYLFSFASIIILYFMSVSFFFKMLFPNVPNPCLVVVNFSRDITLYSFLITITFLHNNILNRENISIIRFYIITFFFSFIPLVAFGYSIDRGFFIFSAYIIISLILYFFFLRKSKFHLHYLISSFSGILAAIVLLYFMLRGNFTEFINYAFIIMPRYKELLDGFAYPIFNRGFLPICILIAANTFWMTYKFFQEYHFNNNVIIISIRKFIREHFLEFCLLILSIFFFRSALGRADWDHVKLTSHITYILSIYIVFKHYLYKYRTKKVLSYLMIFLVILISAYYGFQTYQNNLISRIFSLKTTDSEFIPENYKATISFLKNNLSDKEDFFTMTSEASWYYFIDKPCPARFPVVWFAAPYFYQEEIVRDLTIKKVKYILYKNKAGSNAMDGFDNENRFPIIIRYIKQQYVFHKKIDDNEIWIKKANL